MVGFVLVGVLSCFYFSSALVLIINNFEVVAVIIVAVSLQFIVLIQITAFFPPASLRPNSSFGSFFFLA